jgi:hypothetical protein
MPVLDHAPSPSWLALPSIPDSICSIHACLLVPPQPWHVRSLASSSGPALSQPTAAVCCSAAAPAAAAAPASPPASLHSPILLLHHHHHHHHHSRSLPTHPLLRARRSPSAQPVCLAFYQPASFLFSFLLAVAIGSFISTSPPNPTTTVYITARCRTLPLRRSAAPFACRRLSISMPLIVHCQPALLSLTPGLSDAASLTSARQC